MTDWLRTFTPRPLVWHLAVPERIHQLIIENFGVGSGSLEDSDESYIAPEAHQAPTPLSDLFSVARALAVLVASFDFQGKYENELPPPEEIELFRQHEGLHRFLRKATRPDPRGRFASAGVLVHPLPKRPAWPASITST